MLYNGKVDHDGEVDAGTREDSKNSKESKGSNDSKHSHDSKQVDVGGTAALVFPQAQDATLSRSYGYSQANETDDESGCDVREQVCLAFAYDDDENSSRELKFKS